MKTAFIPLALPAAKAAPKKKSARTSSTDDHLKSLSPEVRAILRAARKLRGSFGPI